MSGIGQKRERAREISADSFDEHEGEDDQEGKENLAFVILRNHRKMRVIMVMSAHVVVIIAMSIVG
ncbi:hypothetical protein ACIPPQ_06365 [Sphingopyxis sp. LARHCG72]